MLSMQAQPMAYPSAPPRAVPAPQANAAPRPTQWQNVPPPPSVVRGVAPEAPAKFVLPRPEALGVATTIPAATVAAPALVDWNQIQARMERLKVVAYQKLHQGDGVRVSLTLHNQAPVNAEATSEAAAIHLALERAERVSGPARP
jgi:hypothetical protein